MSEADKAFEHDGGRFAPGEAAGGVEVQEREAKYGEVVAEVLFTGVISPEDRERMKTAAEVLGLDEERTKRIEQALRAAYEARHRIRVVEAGAPGADGAGDAASASADAPEPAGPMPAAAAPPTPVPTLEVEDELDDGDETEERHSLTPLEPGADPLLSALEGRIAYLQKRNAELVQELEVTKAQLARLDQESGPLVKPRPVDPIELHRRIQKQPRDIAAMRELFRSLKRAADMDQRWRAAHALVFLGEADADERTFHAEHQRTGPIKPSKSLDARLWREALRHPDEEELPGDIFAVIAPCVLLAQLSAIRGKRVDTAPASGSTDTETERLPAIRCVSWAAAILGMETPRVRVERSESCLYGIVPGTPSATRVGERALSPQRLPAELAFAVGRHLCLHRPEHFIVALVGSARELDDLFLAALMIGNPGLPMNEQKKLRVEPVARSIAPLLDRPRIERLREHFLKFVELGGRTNLRRWATARAKTSNLAGLLLANDLGAARTILTEEKVAGVDECIDDLLVQWTGPRFGELRRKLGVAVTAPED